MPGPANSSGSGRLLSLYGRRLECAVLDELLEQVRRGRGTVLVLRGEAGVGKTALLEYVAGRARGCRLARVAGVRSEMELTFAGLHQLCAPMLSRAERLPVPQREALRTAFGLAGGPPPDRFLVGLAVLSLVSEVAAERPLVCVIDVEQWLDHASAQALGIVARRLAVDPVGLVFAARVPGEELTGLRELTVPGLPDADARALLSSALAGPLAAARHASKDTFTLHISMWALPELVEAAARTGKTEVAAGALEQLAETTQAGGTDFGLGLEARCRALLSGGTAADELYREAIDRLGRTRLRPELARAHLLYGEWLRREGRRVDARGQLRTAHNMLDAIGMKAFAARARRELIATGEKVPKRSVEAHDRLTPQEEQIARLARDGRTSPEIGAQLFLSARTVEWHLGKVFTKLGIRSRRELHAALAGPAQQDQPA